MSAPTRIWLSPLHDCDVCSQPFGKVMFDARVLRGPWGNVCQTCFDRDCEGLGIGRGQKYELQDHDGKKYWVLTAGGEAMMDDEG
jgi:hypothetical protein